MNGEQRATIGKRWLTVDQLLELVPIERPRCGPVWQLSPSRHCRLDDRLPGCTRRTVGPQVQSPFDAAVPKHGRTMV